jgi:hypothetical protein
MLLETMDRWVPTYRFERTLGADEPATAEGRARLRALEGEQMPRGEGADHPALSVLARQRDELLALRTE